MWSWNKTSRLAFCCYTVGSTSEAKQWCVLEDLLAHWSCVSLGFWPSHAYLSIFGLQSQLCSAGGFHVASFCIYFYSFRGLHHQRPGRGLQPEIYTRRRVRIAFHSFSKFRRKLMLLSIEMTLQYLMRKCFYLCFTRLINFIRVDIAYPGFFFIAHHKYCKEGIPGS